MKASRMPMAGSVRAKMIVTKTELGTINDDCKVWAVQ
jgi:hypothetical protein